MYSPCIRETSEACFQGCCLASLPGFPDPHGTDPKYLSSAAVSRYNFALTTLSSLFPNTQFSNHESLTPLDESFFSLNKAYPQYSNTNQADQIRAQEYYHLSMSKHVCLDYIGHGLFSYSQLQKLPFFEISYKSVNLNSQILYGGEESELESKIRKRIMGFMNISEADYSMVFTANQSSAFKLLADVYPFQSNQNLLTVYDYENEARSARVLSAEFSWPNLRIHSAKLKKIILNKRKKRRGLFVFPLQSRMTGARYSYLWMSMAQEHGWHVLLDACALGPKDMETLGLSLFRPDFLICSFFKVFGKNPSGFGCLFVKKSSASILKDSTTAVSVGIVSLLPATRRSQLPDESATTDIETEQTSKLKLHKDGLAAASSLSGPLPVQKISNETFESYEISDVSFKQKGSSSSEIVELEMPLDIPQSLNKDTSVNGYSQIECRGLDHADSLGLILISLRARFLINWLVNALMSLRHPHSENGLPLVRIYGPNVAFDRGPAVAFNVFDWKGEKVEPTLVQKLADRSNISLSHGFLQHIWFSDKYEEEKEKILELRTIEVEGTLGNKKREKSSSGISVVSAALGLLTNFEDMYNLWAFVSRFLDADFVEKERWRYVALNQKTVEV
ncbi:hypothetical protein PVL29_001912 [Vitis rotundifolia]|uniref:Molybdenum cofactor sulfurase n=1 Tax=Vitis rotundifolia TaxID=103349 RepID=A0AA39AFH5_VITRO|nr:hypothetical protein PVL29_001912 [Vitis rotundifolia]